MKRNEKNEKQMAVLPKGRNNLPQPPYPFVCMSTLPLAASLVHVHQLSHLPLSWFSFNGPPSHCPPGSHLCLCGLPILVCTCSQCVGQSALIHACLCLCTLIYTCSWCLGLVFVYAHPCSCGLACLCSCTVWAVCHCSCPFMVFWAVPPLSTLVHVCMD